MLVMASIGTADAGTGHSTATVADLNSDSGQALQALYQAHPFANHLSRAAKVILIFPKIVAAGDVSGEGELISDTSIDGYYRSIGGSWGPQAGAAPFSYAVFLMTDRAVRALHQTRGWKFGAGPTIVVVDENVEPKLSTSTLKDDAYAFVFGPQGLMSGVSLAGTTVSRLRADP
jgi:lipid-binding SYLF domain-containing protein